MKKIEILWVDDEIDLLKPHILFLEKKNYKVTACISGTDAIDEIKDKKFDIIFLDENMPGISGLETLQEIKEIKPNVPIVMITKSEEEHIMEEAIGSKISDYLIKPVHPNQILLSLKKNLDNNRLISETKSTKYQQEFRKISMDLMMINSWEEWVDLYQKLLFWEIELEDVNDSSFLEILESQKQEANIEFSKFIDKNYPEWFQNSDGPIMSHNVFNHKVAPTLRNKEKTLFVVIDNLRLDQWKAFESIVTKHYNKDKEDTFFSILPTATQYSRNAIFSGLMPSEMETKYPDYWKNDTDEGGKNLYEKEFLSEQLKRLGLDIKHVYHKISNLNAGQKLAEQFHHHKHNDLITIVYNFVDMLSHAKTDVDVVKELASTDKAYRSITKSWFQNSPLLDIIIKAKEFGFKLMITTDHGTINVKQPTKIIGDKNTSSNLRYKTGRSLTYNKKDVLVAENPKNIGLPSINMSSSFVFAKSNYFLAYPNNYNHYVNYYKNTYQHGGVSLEEMIIPFIYLSPK